MILLAPELHPLNALFYRLVSRVVPIHVLYTRPVCRRMLGRRLRPLDVGHHLSSEEGWTVCARAVTAWETVARDLPAAPWRVTYRGRVLDFSEKGKQDLGRAYEEFLLLSEIQARGRSQDPVHLLHSGQSAWAARLDGRRRAEAQPAGLSWISVASVVLDRVWMQCVNTARIVRLLGWLVRGLARRLAPSSQTIGAYRYLYWCDSEADFNLSSEKRSFAWIMDGQAISPQDVLVLLPRAVDHASRHWRQQIPAHRPYAVFTFPELYARLPARYLWAAVRDLILLAIRSLVGLRFRVEQVLITRYLTDVIQMSPVLEAARPSWYVESDSSLGLEDPAVLYCQSLGIRTVMYHTSAIFPVAYLRAGLAARDIMHAHILASTVVCWSREAKRFLEAHPQPAGQTMIVCGPMLPGDDSVLHRGPQSLRRRYGRTVRQAEETLKYVTAFDISPYIQDVAPSRYVRPYPHPFTEDLTIQFLQDMLRLLSDLEGIVLVYKPKREQAMALRFPARLAEYRQLVEALRRHERGIVFAHDMNPWIPILMGDVCISLPGGSPPWAAIHHGIPGFFYSAGYRLLGDGNAASVQEHCVQGYDELVAKVRQLCFGAAGGGRAYRTHPMIVREFLGPTPGANSNAAFRQWLASLHEGPRMVAREPRQDPRALELASG